MEWGDSCGRADLPMTAGERSGIDVPGYTGYISGKVPEMDVVGRTFADVNRHVTVNPRTVSGPLGIEATSRGDDPLPRTWHASFVYTVDCWIHQGLARAGEERLRRRSPC